ncbi:MAG: 16S rRNA (guanine(527)-N(7))-methyltransferase RsmG, partial [Desulfocapsaceae bacterium]|nr:16S rRNA (guanine(527)-N(7))-methyltransferase RsmG [Desulfocapsaceae bacterium]
MALQTAIGYPEFARLIRHGSRDFGIDLDEAAVGRLFMYFQELRRWNRKMNLISRETAEQAIVEKHFVDSLALLMLLDEKQDCLLDVGSGAGFPGLVCKIARPEMAVRLVEPRLKRVSFLRHVIRCCELTDISVQSCRLEDLSAGEGEPRFTCIACRAVSDVVHFLALCERFCAADRRVICMKGPKFREEIDACPGGYGPWQLETLSEYNLP